MEFNFACAQFNGDDEHLDETSIVEVSIRITIDSGKLSRKETG
jgi:hypothetical protein